MIVDSSALVCVITGEPEAEICRSMLLDAPLTWVSAASYTETGIVLDMRGSAALSRALDALLDALDIEVVPVTTEQARIARGAYRDYGRGSGHPARLNFGYCFSYALAIESGRPLLFIGDDFAHTDVRIALPRRSE